MGCWLHVGFPIVIDRKKKDKSENIYTIKRVDYWVLCFFERTTSVAFSYILRKIEFSISRLRYRKKKCVQKPWPQESLPNLLIYTQENKLNFYSTFVSALCLIMCLPSVAPPVIAPMNGTNGVIKLTAFLISPCSNLSSLNLQLITLQMGLFVTFPSTLRTL